MRRSSRRVVVLCVAVGVLVTAGFTAAFADGGVGQPCDNGANSENCTVSGRTVTLPVDVPVLNYDRVEVGPVNVGGDTSCSGAYACGFQGTGPVAIGGNASCSTSGYNQGGCGALGAGPVAVGGNASCSADGLQTNGCGSSGTGALAVGGNASCSAQGSGSSGCGNGFLGFGAVAVGGNASCSAYNGCGSGNTGIGPVAVGGNAYCYAASQGCGELGTGPIATGDVSCWGTCGAPRNILGVDVPRTGTPGIAVTGHAYCATPFDRAQATSVGHLESFGCISVADTVNDP